MYILVVLSFIFSGCLGVFFYLQLKEKEDDIEELYNLFYEKKEEERIIKNKKGNILKYDKRIY